MARKMMSAKNDTKAGRENSANFGTKQNKQDDDFLIVIFFYIEFSRGLGFLHRFFKVGINFAIEITK